MSEPTGRERMLPYLLDRLTNDNPRGGPERASIRSWSLKQAHQAVVRDLGWLLNTTCRPDSDNLDEFPEVSKSVLNYGLPDLCGQTVSGVSAEKLQQRFIQAVQRFEPRILRHSLSVRALPAQDQSNNSSVTLEIKGQIWATPVPDSLFVKTELDLESGQYQLTDKQYG